MTEQDRFITYKRVYLVEHIFFRRFVCQKLRGNSGYFSDLFGYIIIRVYVKVQFFSGSDFAVIIYTELDSSKFDDAIGLCIQPGCFQIKSYNLSAESTFDRFDYRVFHKLTSILFKLFKIFLGSFSF